MKTFYSSNDFQKKAQELSQQQTLLNPPAIPFIRSKKERSKSKEDDKDSYKTIEVRIDPSEEGSDSETIEKRVKQFEDGTAEEWIQWRIEFA